MRPRDLTPRVSQRSIPLGDPRALTPNRGGTSLVFAVPQSSPLLYPGQASTSPRSRRRPNPEYTRNRYECQFQPRRFVIVGNRPGEMPSRVGWRLSCGVRRHRGRPAALSATGVGPESTAARTSTPEPGTRMPGDQLFISEFPASSSQAAHDQSNRRTRRSDTLPDPCSTDRRPKNSCLRSPTCSTTSCCPPCPRRSNTNAGSQAIWRGSSSVSSDSAPRRPRANTTDWPRSSGPKATWRPFRCKLAERLRTDDDPVFQAQAWESLVAVARDDLAIAKPGHDSWEGR